LVSCSRHDISSYLQKYSTHNIPESIASFWNIVTPPNKQKPQTPWPKFASELYRPSYRCLSPKLLPHLWIDGATVSVMDLYGRILRFIDQSRYCFFPVAAQLYSRGWVDQVPNPLLQRESGSAGNQTRTSGSVGRNSEH
jgi:hypothetical protein